MWKPESLSIFRSKNLFSCCVLHKSLVFFFFFFSWSNRPQACQQHGRVAGRFCTTFFIFQMDNVITVCVWKYKVKKREKKKKELGAFSLYKHTRCHKHTRRLCQKHNHNRSNTIHMGIHVWMYITGAYVNTHKNTQAPSESQTPSVAVWQSTVSARGHKWRRQMASSTDCLECKMANLFHRLTRA